MLTYIDNGGQTESDVLKMEKSLWDPVQCAELLGFC